MRDLGYSLQAAVADLVDNSITAAADKIDIVFDMSAEPIVLVMDNGKGMAESELVAAMRHGTVSPKARRRALDLGRFGLGLKTASFSQCRLLTVVSAQDGVLCGAEWDLDRIDDEDEWMLSILDQDDISSLPYVDRLGTHGTVVMWRKLDRLVEDAVGVRRDEIVSEKIGVLGKHLSLVFHRFLSGEIKAYPRISITINGHAISAFDPFCRKNPATQVLPEEIVRIGESEVRLQPYILPHHSRLSSREYEFYQSRSDFISNQGAYIYRNGRLMAWGDWFRLVPKGEATKLARVQIDFSNSLDEAWTIDIKKSRARPPHAVRERLHQIVEHIAERSVRTYRNRGQKRYQEAETPIWERYDDNSGIRYAINIQHPIIESLCVRLSPEDAKALHLLLESVASSLPIEMIYSDYSTHPREVRQVSVAIEQAVDHLKGLKQILYGDGPADPVAFLQIVISTGLFDGHIEAAKAFISETF